MMNAVLASGNAVAVVFGSINSKLNARTVDPSALQLSNQHDPSDTPGAGSTGNGTQVTGRPLNAGAAPSSSAPLRPKPPHLSRRRKSGGRPPPEGLLMYAPCGNQEAGHRQKGC